VRACVGWRRQAFYDERYVTQRKLLQSLGRACPSGYRPSRRTTLRSRQLYLGRDVLQFEELEAMLRAVPAVRYRWGLTHGDLHGQNVKGFR
jgi:hypothetical protein